MNSLTTRTANCQTKPPGDIAANGAALGTTSIDGQAFRRDRPDPGEYGWRLHYSAEEASQAELDLAFVDQFKRLPPWAKQALATILRPYLQPEES